MIQTRYFTIAPGRYVRQALGIWFSRWWWIIVLPVAALIIAGMHDARYYIVALALVLVVYPGIMMLIYFNHALRPEAAMSTLQHSISISEQGIDITYADVDDRPTPRPRHIAIKDIDSVEDTGTSMLIHLSSGRYDFIEIPAEQFEPGDFSKAIRELQKPSTT